MVTPLPYLATLTPDVPGKYPKVSLPGIEQQVPEEEPNRPKAMTSAPAQKGGFGDRTMPQAAKGGKTETKSSAKAFWKNIQDADLVARFSGKFNVFDPLGRPAADSEEEKKKPPAITPCSRAGS